MKYTFTIILLVLSTKVWAQRIRYSPRETQCNNFASYNIIGQINNHYLIFIKGEEAAEIGVYDEDMNKVNGVPANFLKSNSSQADFFAYPDHFLLFFHYRMDSVYYCSMLKGDADGHVTEGPIVMDSVVLSRQPVQNSKAPAAIGYEDRPMHIVLRSENRQWFMILKAAKNEGDAQQLDATLFDKDLQPLGHRLITYSRQKDSGKFSEFILDNDGDLAFIYFLRDQDDDARIQQANFFFKPHETDSLFTTPISLPGIQLDDLNIRIDNANHRYILNSFYYPAKKPDLAGLYSLIWDKQRRGLTSSTVTPLSPELCAEARSDFSSPDQVLNSYYIRQVVPFSDGGYMLLAEMCYGPERLRSSYWRRADFIRGIGASILTHTSRPIDYEPREKPGWWQSEAMDKMRGGGNYGLNKNTDNILVFIMDREGQSRNIKVIHKTEYAVFALHTLSYQTFIDSKAIHVIYNEKLKGRYLPVVTSIQADGTIGSDPILPGLDRNYLFLPRFSKQVSLHTSIIPCEDGIYLRFARVDF